MAVEASMSLLAMEVVPQVGCLRLRVSGFGDSGLCGF